MSCKRHNFWIGLQGTNIFSKILELIKNKCIKLYRAAKIRRFEIPCHHSFS